MGLKLTKEQAEWLINKFKKEIYADGHGFMMAVMLPDEKLKAVSRIINQCTEKEFPYFLAELSDQGSIELNGSIHRGAHVSIGMSFKGVKGAVACLDLNHDEFKHFAIACGKVVGWLDEQ